MKIIFICSWLCTLCTLWGLSQAAVQDIPVTIEVVASGIRPTEAALTVFVSAPEGRRAILRSPAFLGKNGVTPSKREGDGATPLGEFRVERAFGLAENPGTRLPYTRVGPQDVWVDDPASRVYNQPASRDAPDRDWASAEELAQETVAYRYVAVIEYNTDPVVKGAGSAIFLHCSTGNPTAGCVSIPTKTMRRLLQLLVPGTKIHIKQGTLP